MKIAQCATNEDPATCIQGQEPYRVFVGGEPFIEGERDMNDYDIGLVAGMHNKYSNAAFVNTLIAQFRDEHIGTENIPLKDRPIDILFRSSLCSGDTKWRDELAAMIRKEAEDANLTFAATGSCTGGTKKAFEDDYRTPGHYDNWQSCPECDKSKLILAFEKTTTGNHYMSEKVFHPDFHDALAAYVGTASEDDMVRNGLNPDRIISMGALEPADVFAKRVVSALTDQRMMEDMEAAPRQRPSVDTAAARQLSCGDPRIQHLRNLSRPIQVALMGGRFPDGGETYIRDALCLEKAVFELNHENDVDRPDIVLDAGWIGNTQFPARLG
jgi:hypothetical protein